MNSFSRVQMWGFEVGKQKKALGTCPRASTGRAIAINIGEPDEV
jgi:hypothetical protein